ncbi:MAG: ATP-binding protein [Lachnospiraceae bacterium]|nr:ATP-binding protein [Lachnospiraceae bacterium]
MSSVILRTNHGEYVGASVLEITEIPAIDILKDSYDESENIEYNYQKKYSNLLSEIYQIFRNSKKDYADAEVCVEIMLLTEPAINQPYDAEIKTYLVIRNVENTQEKAASVIEQLARICIEMLSFSKYGVNYVDFSSWKDKVQSAKYEGALAICKSEYNETIPNSIIPSCYSYDKFLSTATTLSDLVNSLIHHPNTIVSFQLIATSFSSEEITAISDVTGMFYQNTENLGFLEKKIYEHYGYYMENKDSALFRYNILVCGDSVSLRDVSSKIYRILNDNSNKLVQVKEVNLSINETKIENSIISAPWYVNNLVMSKNRLLDNAAAMNAYYRLPYIITAEEAAGFFRVPIGSQNIRAGFNVRENESGKKTYRSKLINTGSMEIGTLVSAGGENTIGLDLNDLTKHMLVCGTPGSGKTTFSVSVLDRLWKDHNIPFLVIEPAKNEYRALAEAIDDLQIFTPGKNFISPFVFNPFVPPKNVKLETYKSTLKTAFSAAVSMTTPLDKIFEETIHNCYSDFAWLDTYTSDDGGKIFNISDFIKCFQYTFENIGYTGDVNNIGRAGVVRLKGLVNLFDNYFSIPIEDILSKPTVIELSAIENSDEKALIIALLLLSILAYVNANYVGEGDLKNVILLEEAHVLLDAESNAGQGEANPSRIAQNLVKRMLAECRSYGVGMIIADQSPRKVTTDVVALTDMKMIFRLVEATDKQIIADSMNMTDVQKQRLGRLRPGSAFLFFNRMDEPEEVSLSDYRMEKNIRISLSDDGIREISTYWKNKADKLIPYPECMGSSYCKGTCDYYMRVLARDIARRIFMKRVLHVSNSKDSKVIFDAVNECIRTMPKLIRNELNKETYSKELLACVLVHFMRKVKYETKLSLSDEQILDQIKKA